MISGFASVLWRCSPQSKASMHIHAYPCIHGAHPGAHWRARQKYLISACLDFSTTTWWTARSSPRYKTPSASSKSCGREPEALRASASEIWSFMGTNSAAVFLQNKIWFEPCHHLPTPIESSQYTQGMHKTCLLLSPLGCLKCWGALTDHILL